MERRTATGICVAFVSLTLVGCATIFRGSSETISFVSEPSKAEVKLSTGQACRTPCELEVNRKGEVFVTISKDGYKPFETALVATIDGASLAGYTTFNFVMLPGVNDLVDYNTRANYSRKPNPLTIELLPEDSGEDYEPLPLEAPPAEETEASSSEG